MIPALFTRMSIRPHFSMTAATIASTDARSRTSAAIGRPSAPHDSMSPSVSPSASRPFRLVAATFAPAGGESVAERPADIPRAARDEHDAITEYAHVSPFLQRAQFLGVSGPEHLYRAVDTADETLQDLARSDFVAAGHAESRASACTDSVQRTGAVICRRRRSRIASGSVTGSAQTLAITGTRGRANAVFASAVFQLLGRGCNERGMERAAHLERDHPFRTLRGKRLARLLHAFGSGRK